MADDVDPDAARWVSVCTEAWLTEAKIVCAQVDGVALIVIQDGNQVRACERACPHEQADLGRGRIDNGRLYCPRHAAWFDLLTGDISAGWPSRCLQRYRARLYDAHVWIDAASLGNAKV